MIILVHYYIILMATILIQQYLLPIEQTTEEQCMWMIQTVVHVLVSQKQNEVLAIHGLEEKYLKTQSIHFSQNYATISGSTLYGGLLDRCAVSQFAEVHKKYSAYDYNDRDDGITYFNMINTNLSISSQPVRVCLCINNEHDCSHQGDIEVQKGHVSTVSLVARAHKN